MDLRAPICTCPCLPCYAREVQRLGQLAWGSPRRRRAGHSQVPTADVLFSHPVLSLSLSLSSCAVPREGSYRQPLLPLSLQTHLGMRSADVWENPSFWVCFCFFLSRNISKEMRSPIRFGQILVRHEKPRAVCIGR